MKKLWKSFKFLFLTLIFPISSHSLELNEYGLNHNSFSELRELRTIYYTEDIKYIDPEDTENLTKIKEFYTIPNFLSDEIDTVYQFCCNSKSDAFILIGKINNAEDVEYRVMFLKSKFLKIFIKENINTFIKNICSVMDEI